jgi:diguanylate cyclase (GGDEF)-like protein
MNAPLVILTISCVVALAMGAILFAVAKTYPRTIRGLTEWSAAAAIIGLSLPLFIARGAIPDAFSIVVANLMILAGFMMMSQGVRKFAGVRPRFGRAALAGFVLSYLTLFVWFTYVDPSIGMRIATMTTFTLVVVADQLAFVLRTLPRTAGRHVLVASLALLIASRLVRLGGLALGLAPPTGVFDPSLAQLAYVGLPSITIPIGAISLIMLASERLHRDLEFASRYDDLTQCLNKKSAMEELQREIARARRHGNKLSIMLIDLDNFKDINDTYGHLEGDKVLADFSERTRSALRETDRLTRFGGDEFLAILPDTDVEQAAAVATRIHAAGKQGEPAAWSVSVGISQWLENDDTLAALMTRSDTALYRAKALGRHQTQSI